MNTSALPLAYLLPIGLALVAWSAAPAARLREAALAALVVAVVSAVAYIGFGFALQFGGIGLTPGAPAGLLGLDKAWSPFPVDRWAVIGLEGFFASGDGSPQALALVETLALHRLPMAIAAGLIPALALDERATRIGRIAAAIVAAAIVFPISGAWIWGGGWLAMLGQNLNFGHGAIDVLGSGVTFFAASAAAWIALQVFDRSDAPPMPAFPTLHQPLLALIGAAAFGAGWSAWAVSDPLLTNYAGAQFMSGVSIGLVGAAASALAVAVCAWFFSGRILLLAAIRGWIAGWVAIGAAIWFIPPGAAIVSGIVAGVISIAIPYGIGRSWRLGDRAGLLAICGFSGAWGLVAAGLFADGVFGAGWNGVQIGEGVRGLLASDPGQLSAQLLALAAIGLFASAAATFALWPLSLLLRRITPTASPPPGPPATLEPPHR